MWDLDAIGDYAMDYGSASQPAFDVLKANFDAAYAGNRAPFPIFVHVSGGLRGARLCGSAGRRSVQARSRRGSARRQRRCTRARRCRTDRSRAPLSPPPPLSRPPGSPSPPPTWQT